MSTVETVGVVDWEQDTLDWAESRHNCGSFLTSASEKNNYVCDFLIKNYRFKL